ncbi:DUF4251 domain-containing protein [Chitinophaga deserti]|uniref:DUF4251 domain-containing protein n=1 Tax=Chitinophaga deserti TaxID=2164099 RepID=UPI000D6BF802|nr:DUF4251 domain-containing protein [Chitinophaga deserti]
MRIFNTIPVWLLAFTAMACSTTQQASSTSTADMKSIISARTFVFQAQTVLPMSGRTRQVSGDGYEVIISKDTVNSYLPYFGRAYSAPIDPSRGGYDFVSTNFEYTETPRKDGGWEITIKPRDVRDIQQMFLSVSENGYGSLQVTSNNRQPISYNGIVTAESSRKRRK